MKTILISVIILLGIPLKAQFDLKEYYINLKINGNYSDSVAIAKFNSILSKKDYTVDYINISLIPKNLLITDVRLWYQSTKHNYIFFINSHYSGFPNNKLYTASSYTIFKYYHGMIIFALKNQNEIKSESLDKLGSLFVSLASTYPKIYGMYINSIPREEQENLYFYILRHNDIRMLYIQDLSVKFNEYVSKDSVQLFEKIFAEVYEEYKY